MACGNTIILIQSTNMLGGVITSNHIRNQTKEFPTSLDAFRHLVKKLIDAGGERWIHFDGPEKEAWVEVANDSNDYLELNFSFPFKENLQELFLKRQIVVPDDWKLINYKPQRLGGFFAGYACYSIHKNNADLLPLFIDDLFVKLYTCAKDYSMSGYLT